MTPCRRSPPQTQCCLVNQLHVMSSCKRYAKHLRKCAHIPLGNIYSIDLYELYQYQSFFNDVYVFIQYLHDLSHPYAKQYIYCFISTVIFLQIYTSPTNVLKGPLRCTPRSNESNCFFQIASVYICLADKQNLEQQLVLIRYHSAQLSDFTGEQHSSNMEINWFDVACCCKQAGLLCKISGLYFDLVQLCRHHFLSTLLFTNYKSVKPNILSS